MKIGYDGKRAMSNMTGLGNYSRLVVESMAAAYPEMPLVLYAPRDNDNPRLQTLRQQPNVQIRLPRKGEARWGRSHWRSYEIGHILPNEEITLYHGLSNELPLNIAHSGVPSVVTMHDVIYRRLPYCYSPIDRRIYDYKYGRSCQAATRIIAVSECTKRDVMHYYGIPEQRIDVVYQGCDAQFYREQPQNIISQIQHKYNLPENYIIQVGSIERRKNALATVRALTALPQETNLLLVGRGTDYLKKVQREAKRLGVAGRLHVLSGVPFAELPALYQGSKAAVYPSYYEGFGIPVLEALAGGVPCVAATGSCLEEAGGDGALYVDSDNPRQLAEALTPLLTDTTRRDALVAAGRRHAARFDNSDMARRIYNVYRKALAGV